MFVSYVRSDGLDCDPHIPTYPCVYLLNLYADINGTPTHNL